MGIPLDLHEWISFEDDREQRTWMFDATFLRSNWSCIFGAGCKGVLDDDAAALQQGCCSHGAHFIDDADVQTVVDAVARLAPEQWQHYKKGHRKGVLATDDEGTTTTRVVGGACIFHNEPGFAGGSGCALHIAATEAGERYIDWKPDVCWQLPLRLEHSTDDNGYLTSTLREWKRRDWGAGGAEFHWWCTDAPDAFVGSKPVYRYLRDEIVEFVGRAVYERLVELLERPTAVPLAHPAIRR
jgi:hypothetical protein